MEISEIRRKEEELRSIKDEERIVWVSTLAEYFIPDSATGDEESKNKGARKHKEVEEESKEISREELWSKIEGEGGVFPEMFLRAEAPIDDQIVLSGKIDMAVFRDQKPVLVLERKFPNDYNLRNMYDSEKMQAFTYALMLDELGFDTSSLRYCVLKMERKTSREARRAFDQRLLRRESEKNLEDINLLCKEFEYECNVFVEEYERERRFKKFKEALDSEL